MAIKEVYSPQFIESLGASIHAVFPTFGVAQFEHACLGPDWQALKLMERRDRITVQLHEQLPADFPQAAQILRQIGPQFTGLAAICLPNYVAMYGLADWQVAMTTLELLTQYSSAEFAIRPFLVRYPTATEQQMVTWSQSAQVDVRRLASEGIRPRLPWGIRLTAYVNDPQPVMAVLKNLITDPEVYVQKSVANNLNDISKDHPNEVIAFAQRYWGQSVQTDWMLKRGLRTLFKQGNRQVLALLGYRAEVAEELSQVQLSPAQQITGINTETTHRYMLQLKSTTPQNVYVGYRVHYVRQNKTDAFKDFFLKRTTLQPGNVLTGEFKVKWRQLTTRRLYPGIHPIELLVNTEPVAQVTVDFQPKQED